ncbi:MAG: hypothetical protein RSF83_02920, partial [Hungatella sp.]
MSSRKPRFRRFLTHFLRRSHHPFRNRLFLWSQNRKNTKESFKGKEKENLKGIQKATVINGGV